MTLKSAKKLKRVKHRNHSKKGLKIGGSSQLLNPPSRVDSDILKVIGTHDNNFVSDFLRGFQQNKKGDQRTLRLNDILASLNEASKKNPIMNQYFKFDVNNVNLEDSKESVISLLEEQYKLYNPNNISNVKNAGISSGKPDILEKQDVNTSNFTTADVLDGDGENIFDGLGYVVGEDGVKKFDHKKGKVDLKGIKTLDFMGEIEDKYKSKKKEEKDQIAQLFMELLDYLRMYKNRNTAPELKIEDPFNNNLNALITFINTKRGVAPAEKQKTIEEKIQELNRQKQIYDDFVFEEEGLLQTAIQDMKKLAQEITDMSKNYQTPVDQYIPIYQDSQEFFRKYYEFLGKDVEKGEFELLDIGNEKIGNRLKWCNKLQELYITKHGEIIQIFFNILKLLNGLIQILYFFERILYVYKEDSSLKPTEPAPDIPIEYSIETTKPEIKIILPPTFSPPLKKQMDDSQNNIYNDIKTTKNTISNTLLNLIGNVRSVINSNNDKNEIKNRFDPDNQKFLLNSNESPQSQINSFAGGGNNTSLQEDIKLQFTDDTRDFKNTKDKPYESYEGNEPDGSIGEQRHNYYTSSSVGTAISNKLEKDLIEIAKNKYLKTNPRHKLQLDVSDSYEFVNNYKDAQTGNTGKGEEEIYLANLQNTQIYLNKCYNLEYLYYIKHLEFMRISFIFKRVYIFFILSMFVFIQYVRELYNFNRNEDSVNQKPKIKIDVLRSGEDKSPTKLKFSVDKLKNLKNLISDQSGILETANKLDGAIARNLDSSASSAQPARPTTMFSGPESSAQQARPTTMFSEPAQASASSERFPTARLSDQARSESETSEQPAPAPPARVSSSPLPETAPRPTARVSSTSSEPSAPPAPASSASSEPSEPSAQESELKTAQALEAAAKKIGSQAGGGKSKIKKNKKTKKLTHW